MASVTGCIGMDAKVGQYLDLRLLGGWTKVPKKYPKW